MKNDFFALLRAGVTGCADIKLTHLNWDSVYECAERQNVLPLIFDGYQRYYGQSGLAVSTDVKLRLFAATQLAEQHYAKQLQAIRTLTGYLAEHNIKTMILKGYGLSLCYPIPSHRPCGDIDIYQFGRFNESDELLAKRAGIKIDRTHHHHTCYTWNGVSVENHYDFVNQYTHPIHKKLEVRLKELAETEEPEVVNGILLPSPNLAALFTFVHSMSEWVGESVPLRQVADWWLLRKHYGDRVDWQKIEQICEELGFGQFLRVWTEVAEWLFDVDFNPDFDYDRLSETVRRVMEDLLTPKFGRGEGRTGLQWWLYRLRRWFGNRWKMQLAYSSESLLEQFVMHSRSHLLKPENLLKK